MDILPDIRRWLDRSAIGYDDPVEEIPVEGIQWQMKVYFPDEDDTTDLAGFSDQGIVAARRTTGVADEHLAALSDMSESEFRDFHTQLRRDLLLVGVLFNVDIDRENQKISRLSVASRMYPDEMIRADLIEGLQSTYNASLLAKIRFQSLVPHEHTK